MAALKMEDACTQVGCRFAHGGLSSGDADGRGGGTLMALTQHGACCACSWGAPLLRGSPKPPLAFPGRRKLWGFKGHLSQPRPSSRRTQG